VIFKETDLKGAFVLELERLTDDRGFFARSWCRKEFLEHGLNPQLVQCNVSFNKQSNTLRGMHYQAAPYEEAKLVRCTRGFIYDVIIDLRPASRTFTRHFGILLDAEKRNMLYIPEGFAHGFLTLEDDSEIFYQMSEFYEPSSARGVRWNDPAFDIRWPADVSVISDRDRSYPDFDPGSVG
jgi:dTDP-4-dehydrorhamnose 3,5-epimerase